MRKNWQNQLREVQSEIGFEYIRFHGIFSDEMMVCNLGREGNMNYNWSYVDELFDFFRETGIKPFLELSFMPSELKRTNKTMFWQKANISPPRDMGAWTGLVTELTRHCVNRYGLGEVETWYYEIWNEPDYENVFWAGSKEEYFAFYRQTALAIKSISERIRVGGPSVTHQSVTDPSWLTDFLLYCKNNAVPLDFVSLHIYPETIAPTEHAKVQDLWTQLKQGESPEKLMKNWLSVKRIYLDRNNTYDALVSADAILKEFAPHDPQLHITEWNASAYGRNLIHDTCYVAAFIIRSILQCIGKADSIGYWTFTDIMEETKAGISAFHGGFGLISRDGLKKPAYYAYWFLSRLGREILVRGEEFIVTRAREDIQILACNFAYFDSLFLSGDTSALTATDRYSIYESGPDKEIRLCIAGLAGKYKITRYRLDRQHGSVFDEWVRMGAPEEMTQQVLQYLKGKARPEMAVKCVDLNGEYREKLIIPVHGVRLITLKRQM